jgi:hypothetical protein
VLLSVIACYEALPSRYLRLTSLGVFVALHADRLAGALARTGVGASALTANRETAAMTNATVAIDRLEALEILLQFAAKVALDHILVLLNDLDDAVELLIGQRLGADIGADFSHFQDVLGAGRPNAVNVGESGFNPFVTGDIDTEEARHSSKGFLS